MGWSKMNFFIFDIDFEVSNQQNLVHLRFHPKYADINININFSLILTSEKQKRRRKGGGSEI